MTVGLALSCVLTACGDHPVPEHGIITDAKFTPAWIQVIPGTTICSGNPPVCTTTPMQVIPWPDEWRLEVTDLKNHDWTGTTAVSELTYERCNLGELWPECDSERGVVKP